MARMDGLPNALRLLRESRGFSQRKVAEVTGVEPWVVSRWERGRGEPPDLKQFGLLADFLGLNLGELDDALVLGGGWPPRRSRGITESDLDPRRIAQLLLGNPDDVIPDVEEETQLTDLLETAFALGRWMRARRSVGGR